MQSEETGMRLDVIERCLYKNDREVRLTATLCAMLAYFVGNRRRLISRSELLEAVWPAKYVSESRVKQVIQQLRVILEDDACAPRHIENHHGLGYRYIGEIRLRGEESGNGQHSKKQDVSESFTDDTHKLYGRDQELSNLDRWFRDTLNGRRRVVFITGEANIGKSRLVERFVDNLRSVDKLALGCAGFMPTDNRAASSTALLEILQSLVDCTDSERLRATLEQMDSGRPDAGGSSEENGRPRPVQRTGETGNASQTVAILARAVDDIAKRQPLILWLDDAHWIDNSSLELITRLATRRGPAQLMILCCLRPEETADRHHPLTRALIDLQAHNHATELRLAPLCADAASDLLADRLPGIPAPMVERVRDLSGGHPWFLSHLAETLMDSGLLRAEGAGWIPAEGWEKLDLPVPQCARQMVEWQLEELTPAQQELVETGAVLGNTFSVDLVALASGFDPIDIESGLEAVTRTGKLLLRSADGQTQEPGYGFRYRLYRNAILTRVAPLRRKRILEYAEQHREPRATRKAAGALRDLADVAATASARRATARTASTRRARARSARPRKSVARPGTEKVAMTLPEKQRS